MILPESVDKLLKNPVVRFLAAVGLLLLVAGIISGLLISLGDLSSSDVIFDRFWNIRYFDLAAALLAVGLWIALSIKRRFEQPWWILVALAFLAWTLIVIPVSFELPRQLIDLFAIAGFGLSAVGLLAAFATLDRAIPKLVPAPTAAQGVVPAMGSRTDHLSDHAPAQAAAKPQAPSQPRQAGTQAAGWYPDPRKQATWRWWDGSTWTENVG